MLAMVADYSALDRYIERLEVAAEQVRPELWIGLLVVAENMEDRIEAGMPVDTGRARAGWGHYNPELLVPRAIKVTQGSKTRYITRPGRITKAPQVSSATDAVWIEDRENLTILEGTRVPYVEQLNEGSSTQAPAGFIDLAVDGAGRQLDKLERIVRAKFAAASERV